MGTPGPDRMRRLGRRIRRGNGASRPGAFGPLVHGGVLECSSDASVAFSFSRRTRCLMHSRSAGLGCRGLQ